MPFNFSRYQNRDVFRNSEPEYAKQLSARSVRFIDHFTTANFRWPTPIELASLDIEVEYWGVGSRFYKLAAKHYGDASLWWIIPWFNQMPLESDFRAGYKVLIPVPLQQVLSFFR